MHSSRLCISGVRLGGRTVSCPCHNIQIVRLLKAANWIYKRRKDDRTTLPNKLRDKFRLGMETLRTAMNDGEAHTWWEKSASMIITKSPVTKFKPWIYAVLCYHSAVSSLRYNKAYPKPSFPARGLRTYRSSYQTLTVAREIKPTIFSSPYTFVNCFAISWVPSGLASSTMITSQSNCLVANFGIKERDKEKKKDVLLSKSFR